MGFTYQDALTIVLFLEGGYVNHPNDHGGATNCGVTQKTYDAYRSYKNLPRQHVSLISSSEISDVYKIFYWDKVHGDYMLSLSAGLSLVMFDAAVHHGPSRSIKFLQQGLGIPSDGVYGPQTEEALKVIHPDSGFINFLLNTRLAFLMRLANKPGQSVFRAGWRNRIDNLKKRLPN